MPLSSTSFLLLAACAIVALNALRDPWRGVAFLALNLAFVASHLDAAGGAATASMLAAAWAFTRLPAALAARALAPALLAFTAGFVWLRDYDFLTWVLPSAWRAHDLFPAGASFLFFKLVHVLVEHAAGRIPALPPLRFANYGLNFTAFLLGPIQRYPDFEAQWAGRTPSIAPGFEAHLDAVIRVARGLVKKYVLAEALGPYVLRSGLDLAGMPSSELLLRTYAFYGFLYLDFSGYCDVVIGIGSLMGVRPPENFDLPFLARNVAEYWLRVHRSLTTWLTDYVFQPVYAASLRRRLLGGGFGTLAGALAVTMLVSGLWHGTTASFLVFGALHAAYLVIFRGTERVLLRRLGRARLAAFARRPLVHALAVLVTFHATALAYAAFVLDGPELALYARRVVGL